MEEIHCPILLSGLLSGRDRQRNISSGGAPAGVKTPMIDGRVLTVSS
jgi:hypothetical protein